MSDTPNVPQTPDSSSASSASSSSDSGNSTPSTPASTPSTPAAEPSTPAKKRTLESIVSEKYDELATKKADEAKADPQKPGQRQVPATPAAATPATPATPAAPAPVVDPITGRTLEPVKVPQSAPAILREDWSKLPRNWQEYISKRENDMRQQISRLGESNKFATELQTEAKPLLPFLKQNNITLNQLTKDLYKTSHRLAAGNPHQRAQVISELILAYKPDSTTLKQALEAGLKGQRLNIPAVQAPVDMDAKVNEEIQKRQQTAASGQSTAAVEAFYSDPKNEFAQELDKQIGAAIQGGFVQMAKPDGSARPMGEILEDAYKIALQHSTTHQAILTARGGNGGGQPANPAAAANPNAGIQPVRQAAPSPGGGKPVAQKPKSYGKNIHKAAEDAWEALASRK